MAIKFPARKEQPPIPTGIGDGARSATARPATVRASSTAYGKVDLAVGTLTISLLCVPSPVPSGSSPLTMFESVPGSQETSLPSGQRTGGHLHQYLSRQTRTWHSRRNCGERYDGSAPPSACRTPTRPLGEDRPAHSRPKIIIDPQPGDPVLTRKRERVGESAHASSRRNGQRLLNKETVTRDDAPANWRISTEPIRTNLNA